MPSEIETTKKFLNAKAKKEIRTLENFLKTGKLHLFLISPKQGGKSVYSRVLQDLFPNNFVKISMGDIIRDYQKKIRSADRREINKVKKQLRRIFPHQRIEKVVGAINRSSPTSLLSTSISYQLLADEIKRNSHGSLIIDGFPRKIDQIAKTQKLYKLLQLGKNRVFFVELDVPQEVLKIRSEGRLVCPKCGFVSNSVTNVSKIITYSKQNEGFVFHCENRSCQKAVLISKTEETPLGLLQEREQKLQQTIKLLKKTSPSQYIVLSTYSPIHEVGLTDAEKTHRAILKFKGGKVLHKEVPLIVKGNRGDKVYPLHSRGAVRRMLHLIADKL